MKKITLVLVACLLLGVFAKAQFVDIPDSAFRTFLISKYPAYFNGSGQMDTTCSGVLNADSMYCSHASIQDLTGVQYFKNLTFLDCPFESLTYLPPLTYFLQKLYYDDNQLTSLTALPSSLTFFHCNSNKLTLLHSLPDSLNYLEC